VAGEPEDAAWAPCAGRPAGVAGWAKDVGETAHFGVKGGKKGGWVVGDVCVVCVVCVVRVK